ncbi:unnamed protein product [Microthlaspi erraticum]|uniref:Uncharacterized protein n=1 Tax=Microthlaspi erraticum TaxID=1685480 RepID=A0A6D2JML6_9BRAS|nr:unnamed protein product [Microthlaspi erraticum]
MAGDCAIDTEKYSLFEDFNVNVKVHSGMCVRAPFLVLDENKKLMLLPLTLLHEEAPDPVNTSSWTEVPNVSTKAQFPLQKWVHVGCEVSRNYMRLYICGEIVGEQVLTSLKTNVTTSDCARKISLFSVGGDGYSVSFIHRADVLPSRMCGSFSPSVLNLYCKSDCLCYLAAAPAATKAASRSSDEESEDEKPALKKAKKLLKDSSSDKSESESEDEKETP